MESKDVVTYLKEQLPEASFDWHFDRKEERLRLTHIGVGQGMTIDTSALAAKATQEGEEALREVVYTIDETFRAMVQEKEGAIDVNAPIYPVIRATSFPKETKEGVPFVTKDHTAETRIYYALDLGTTYRLIDENMLSTLGLSDDELKEAALFRAQSLPITWKEDVVAGNTFYFVNQNDGYDATRILNRSFLEEMEARIEGHMTVSVPHQDVLIVGDIQNDTGYDVLAQLTMHFFTVGTVPITSLSFIYEEGKLEPIFIMAKGRSTKEKENE